MRIKLTARLILTMGLLVGNGMVFADALKLSILQADSGNFYVAASLSEGVQTPMLLDTGSGYVGLSRKTFRTIKDLPGTYFDRTITGIMANGRTQKVPIYRIEALTLSEDCVFRDIEVAVFPNADRDILGLNALKRMQSFTLQMDPPALVASGCV